MSGGRRRAVAFALCLGVLALGLAGLGVWQLQRLAWKRDLIARVEARATAAPVALSEVEGLADRDLEYRRVTVSGHFDHAAETAVTALTKLGGGYWIMTPLIADDGRTVLINRGFAPPEMRDPQNRPESQPAGEVRVTGLVRLSEPGGGFLRRNDPQADRWYSRDVAAIARAKNLGATRPFFIDAEGRGGPPVPGLTVLHFRNAHLVYALTWFTLAAMTAAGARLALRTPPDARENAVAASNKAELTARDRL